MISPKNIIVKPKAKNKVHPRIKHTKAVYALLKNGGRKGEAMREAGYSDTVIKSPSKVTESKGFIMAMNDVGLDIDTLNRALADDIELKPQNRLGELTLAYKLHGKLRDTQEGNKTLILITSGESATRYNLPVKDNTTP
jgi:hypothetical protein